MIRDLSGRESRVVFVYSSVLRNEGRYYSEELQTNVCYAGEPWTFGFEEEEVGGYILDHGFTIEEECNSDELEKRYFTGYNGELLGHIDGTHSTVLEKPIL